ncbi:uncharacterized protein A4U43_C10F14170 [Asparagus officinalis]|uniref:Uncharacterized protein n=1 Tax=Asparagus officinalis TaxID=4686 RepID=A0A5P1E7G1_ASPOF|nr:uncharacterized protein A4U43_C10F14170 [Asparagus officinalis]
MPKGKARRGTVGSQETLGGECSISGAKDESDDEVNEGSTKDTREDNEGLTKEASEDLAKDSWASYSGKKVSKGDELGVQSTPSPPTANVSLPLTPGGGANTP